MGPSGLCLYFSFCTNYDKNPIYKEITDDL